MDTITQQHITLLALGAALLPFLSFLSALFLSKELNRSGIIAIILISLSFLLSGVLFAAVWNKQEVHQQFTWFSIGNWKLTIGILLNNLSVLMMLLVSGIALLVHIYSTRYMRGEPYLPRYWGYLGLFCFSMLALVIADNLLILYMCWELVGFASYLLIGFWFTRHTAVLANKKAFIMNRVGDLGFLIGIMIIFSQFKTLDIVSLFGVEGLVQSSVVQGGSWINGNLRMPEQWLTLTGLAFFLGAAAKSAQFPLHTWLPDAMEGPTSVSSLIHAATMVAAGVFLLARINPIFNEEVLTIIATIGAFTAFLAATIALTKNDIKRILAFSTISQLGFMMLAMGVGATGSAIFHLVTHAFFKCLLFLSAGAVIHEMVHWKEKSKLTFDPQDIRNMGGLRAYMPVTFITMLIASLALAGIPLTSGYLSKDAILIQSFEWAEGKSAFAKLIPYSALITSWMTAFYIARLIFKVFFGSFRSRGPVAVSLHESPAAMKYVLVVLGVFCLFPVFSLNPLLFEDAWLLNGLPAVDGLTRVNAYHTVIPAAVNIVSIIVIYLAYTWYAKRDKSPDFTGGVPFKFAQQEWYLDKLYMTVIAGGVVTLSKVVFFFDRVVVDGMVLLAGRAGNALSAISAWLDKYIVDGIVNGIAYVAGLIGSFVRHFQTGRLQHYLITTFIIILAFFIFKYYSTTI